MNPLRLAYFGLPLGALLLHGDGHELATCALAPVAAPGRRRLTRVLRHRVLEARVLGRRLDAAVDAAMQETAPDLVVSWFWTRQLPERWLAAAKWGGVGVHPSLLPRHRGPNPYFWAIDQGDTETGVSAHRLDPSYDTGAVYAQEACPIGTRNAWQLARALDAPSLRLLRRVVNGFAQGQRPAAQPQSESDVTWAPEPTGTELSADWSWPTERVLRRVRALSPVPGLALQIRGVQFWVTAAAATSDYPVALAPGEAAVLDAPARVVIRTGDGAIALVRTHGEAADGEWSAAELRTRLEKGGA